MVEHAVISKKLSYIDAILDICEQSNIDPEDVRKFISSGIKGKVEGEALRLNLILGAGNTLPID